MPRAVPGADGHIVRHDILQVQTLVRGAARVWKKQVLSARGFKRVGRKAIRIRHINGMEVREKMPRGFKKQAQGVQVSPLNPLYFAPWLVLVAVPTSRKAITCCLGRRPVPT